MDIVYRIKTKFVELTFVVSVERPLSRCVESIVRNLSFPTVRETRAGSKAYFSTSKPTLVSSTPAEIYLSKSLYLGQGSAFNMKCP